ncbi:Hsp70 family protein [Pseudarthrobacter sp. NamE2]|uniref:Hsp70 family protein n=1 Tax=Pseudarthrobacter sp. NamE2 TaxID=2576838 RepID=UPI0010FE7ED8|nr:Hsp70 family protein [Pseudarthrobacter sp. NamE2]TLM84436.1 Hsp70 family protein [Pseudarthrobacter sp. NamE2]
MSYVLAIDVGTSFTAAAVVRFNPGVTPIPETLPLGLRGSAVPSVVYYPEEGSVLVGEAAERRGLDSPSRVVREFKRRVGDAVPIAVGILSLPPEEVFATMARWVVDRAAEREGEPPSNVILTHPAAWGTHRTTVVRDALAARGLGDVTLLTEPEAAALHYASQVRVEDGSIVAVYDLGGGTFDTAVLRKAGSTRFEPLGRPEGIEDLGGADFDAAVFRYVANNTGGAVAGLDPEEPGVLAALARLRRECVEAKEALSSDSEASISVLLPGVQQQVRLVRSEFEALIEESVRDTVDALEQSLAELELEPADLSAVLLIGGSSRIPLVAQLISEQLDRPIAVDADPKSSICLGAAMSAVLAQAAAAEAAAAAGKDAEQTATSVVVPAGPGDAAHAPARPASWSRKGPTAAAAAAHGHHGGAHAPKPTVRLTAIAAAAALVTVLTATAAQGPEGFSNLTAMFVPQAGAAPESNKAGGGSGGAATAGDAAAPLAGIEAGLEKAASSEKAGLDVEASPTSRPSATAETSPTGESSTGSASAADPGTGAAAPGTSPGTAPGTLSGAGGTTAPGATDPTGTPTTAPGTVDPTTPGTTGPVPTDPATGAPPVTEQPPVTGEPQSPATSDPPPPVTSEPPVTEEPPPPAVTEDPVPVTEPEPTTSEAPMAETSAPAEPEA